MPDQEETDQHGGDEVGWERWGQKGSRKDPGPGLDLREQTPGCSSVPRAPRIARMASVLGLNPYLVWFAIDSLPGIAS